MDNVICKANIKPKVKIQLIISAVVLLVIVLFFRIKHQEYFDTKATVFELFDAFLVKEVSPKGHTSFVFYFDQFLMYVVPALFLLLTPLIMSIHSIRTSKKCSLELNENGVHGTRKRLFSTAEIKLPIEKVASIMMKKSFFNKLTGGKTVIISSASGVIKFPWVQNADEFVDATLAKIEEAK